MASWRISGAKDMPVEVIEREMCCSRFELYEKIGMADHVTLKMADKTNQRNSRYSAAAAEDR